MRKLFLSIFIIISNVGISQDTLNVPKLKFGLLFSNNLVSYNFTDLNNTLHSVSLPGIDNPLEYFALGFSVRQDALSSYFQIKCGYLNDTFKSNDPECTFLNVYYLSISYNYNLLNSFETIIFPKLSFGYMKTTLGFSGDTTNSQTFPINLQYPNCILFKSKGFLYADLGVGFERRMKILLSDLYLGLNVSYQLPFNELTFYDISGNQVLNFPQTKLNGFNFELTGRIELDWGRIVFFSKLHEKR